MSTFPLMQSKLFGKDQINLYNGSFQLSSEQGTLEVEGRIYMVFDNKSTIRFDGSVKGGIPPQLMNIQKSEIITPTNLKGKALVEMRGLSFGPFINHSDINGTVLELSKGEKEEKFDRCLLYVSNLDDIVSGNAIKHKGRITFAHLPVTIGEWSIGIQKGFEEREEIFMDIGEKNKDYMLTHVIEIRNTVHDSFTLEDIEPIKETLYWAFAFCISRKVGFPIIKAIREDRLLFEQYTTTLVERYVRINNWFPKINYGFKSIKELIPLFFQAFQDPYLKNALTRSIHWHNEAKQTKYAGQPVINIQIALETTWWLILSQMDESPYNKSTYKNLKHAAAKMKEMADLIKIDDDLDKFSRLNLEKYKVEHFPQLFTKFRNHLVHSQPDALFESFSPLDSHKLAEIGMLYLELSILFILKYKGQFRDYRNGTALYDIKQVPWA